MQEAEAIGLNEGLEMALYIKEMWDEIGSVKGVRVVPKTDSRTLEKPIKVGTGKSSRRLRINIAYIKMLKLEEIDEIARVPGKERW